ncbi:MAG TPA: glycosyltransferase family 25 protein [Acidimicrobiales bacterium]|nr:glycosyltransferase family 25 protein [Acidimicrobiales bacterium]
MQAYVINLARSAERRRAIEDQLRRLGQPYLLVEAVDGRSLDVHDEALVQPALLTRSTFKPGVAACSLSHLRVYERLLGTGEGVALVLEDDALLPVDIGALADETAAHMSGAEVVLLNYARPGGCQLSTYGQVPIGRGRLIAYPVEMDDLYCAAAYLITAEACRRMVERLLPVRWHSDEWGEFLSLGLLERVRCVAPRPVSQDRQFRTTIDAYAAQSLQLRWREAVTKRRVPVLAQARTLRRRVKVRRWRRVELVPLPPDRRQRAEQPAAAPEGPEAVS